MRKLMTTASLAAVLMAGPALAANDSTTTGSDPSRTGSAAVSGSATGGGGATSTTGSGQMTTGAAGSETNPASGADATRTGSAATSGSATGGGMQGTDRSASPAGTAASGTTDTTGSDPARTGSQAAQGSATGGGMGSTAKTTYDQGELHALIGQDVRNASGEDIGEVNDVVMVDGRPVLIVGVGGFLGIGEKEVTVPYDEATKSSEGLAVSMTKDQLKTQPEYNADATAGVSVKDTYKK
ncbi:sporulation protein YlmC with PRC-barrel domain [Constrictibacter sp. MBR-5]|jgi:sporulation protein YlmC with PRC-barrel domain|uniref:PRC-barrel domain-containing protein n=1 Tax=Constrictibacter sp. MBR-5 TaxID=3156467 RepID=UPI003393A571